MYFIPISNLSRNSDKHNTCLLKNLLKEQIHPENWNAVHSSSLVNMRLKTALYRLSLLKYVSKAVHQGGEIRFADNWCIYMLQ